MIDRLVRIFYAILYPLYRGRAPEEQRQHLPENWHEYDRQKRRYGITEGEAVVLDGETCIIHEIDGNGDISTQVTYKNHEKNETYTVGLVVIHHQLNRKT